MSDRITLSLLLYTCWDTFLLSVVLGYCLRISWPLWFFFSPHEICTRQQQQQSCFWGNSQCSLLQYSISYGGKPWGSFIVILNDLLALHWYFARQYVATARGSLLHDFLTIKPDQRIKGIPYTANMTVSSFEGGGFCHNFFKWSILCSSAWLVVYIIFVGPHSWNLSIRKSIQAFKHQASVCFFSFLFYVFFSLWAHFSL